MRQVGHEDSRTTLEVYAQVQQRLSRKQVHQAFDDLLASAGETADVPTDGREKMSRSTIASSSQRTEIGDDEGAEMPRGPREVVHKRKLVAPRMTLSQISHSKSPANARLLEVELGGLEPPTSWVRSRRSPN